MRIDVAFTPAGLASGDVTGRTVFVIDTLRSTTTICTALGHGARGIIPVDSVDEAMRLAQTLERKEVLLAGERHCVRMEGFDLGNSPLEMTDSVVRGKTLVMSTTNGTRAVLATTGAARVYLAAGVNLAAAGAVAREAVAKEEGYLVLCAGRAGAFAMEDAYTAGRLILESLDYRRFRKGLNDAALVSVDLARRYGKRWLRPLFVSAAGRDLRAKGFHDDVVVASHESTYDLLPVFADRRITVPIVPDPNPPARA